ncbi:hypothetical protein B0T17DRAFT_504847 [Bombardia bombarda]|uniref:ML-like domain-containing protein n=1 Tax=Bombardia bombarda TaxID=252184 RepID=A0AA39X7E0_9PEZI|nr:hypothetical protein B0T17DRAFT_504847 [Bombardia bombarda]
MKWALLLLLFLRPAAAAFVAFENCLDDSYKNFEPTPLQWVPVTFDASFDTEDPKHTLRLTMWGNVKGSSTNVTLPPANSSDWTDPTKLDGKILDEPEPNAPNPKLTTLHSKIDVLTYEPWSQNTNFCNASLLNASCPLAPVFGANATSLPHLPYVTMTNDFYSSYAFASFSATFLIISGNAQGTNLGCVSATITPDLGNLVWMLKFLPLLVLIFVGVATVFAGVFSPWGSTDIFHWTSNYGRDADLLRLVTPGFGDCLQYIQFVALTGGLTLNYPGFYQPIVSQASWSTLMFNQSFVSKAPGWSSLQDGIYITNGYYGLQDLAQLVGMRNVEDIWAGMMVWLLVIMASILVLVQAGFFVQWIYRSVKRIPEEDLRAKNIPFTLGNLVRIVLSYFLLPIVALSTFQLVVSGTSPTYAVALAVLTLILIIGFAAWLIYLITRTKPRAFLFDDLRTVLLYGPLYNTYSDEAAAFALVPILLTFLRGIAIGAVQPAGVAQLILLAICEVVHILTLHAFRPFHSPTSMNAYHTLFSALRLITVLLMVSFIPSLGVTEGPKGWIGYAILITHAGVLVLGFFLNAVQTIVEVVARMLGAGGDDIRGQSRGGLSKIFGMRQLSRRMSRRDAGPSRQSQLSNSAMLDIDETAKAGYIMPGGRLRSESAGSMGILMGHHQRSSSGLDNLSLDTPGRNFDNGGSMFTPTTPAGEASTFSFLPSPGGPQSRHQSGLGMQASDPYYRPPRQRRQTLDLASSPTAKAGGSWISGPWSHHRQSQAGGGPFNDPLELDGQISRSATPAPHAHSTVPFAPRTDYSTREVDFYYGVRGQRLNSDAPGRKLGTGPADPTGPMASAAGWLRTMFGGKGKEKAKGFEVVRSSRMPPAMRAEGGDFEDEALPAGIPVAMGVLRNGPIESDDEDDNRKPKTSQPPTAVAPEIDLLTAEGGSHDDDLADLEASRTKQGAVTPDVGPEISLDASNRIQSTAQQHSTQPSGEEQPAVPRKSSKRASYHSRNPSVNVVQPTQASRSFEQADLTPSVTASSRLPFERTPSQKRLSGSSMGATTEDMSQVDGHERSHLNEERPASYGFVHQGSINKIDRDVDLLGSSAEVVDETR